MNMQKRGQVSIFIIIGIVAVAAVIFIFFLFRGFQEKAREVTNPQEYLKSQINDIKRVVIKCLDSESSAILKKLYAQGGRLDPVKYSDYDSKKVSFLCYRVKNNEPCYNMMFTRSEVEAEAKSFLGNNVKKCIDSDLISFKDKDYSLGTGNFNLNLVFDDKALLINLDYPITLTKGSIVEIQKTFTGERKTNFWKAADLASDIVNTESKGEIVKVSEISPNNLDFEISRTEIVGGNLYILASRQDELVFYFAVES